MRKLAIIGVGVVVFFALIFYASAAPLAKPVIVTVTKTDATTFRGQLTDADPHSITLMPLVKGKPEGEKVTIEWTNIKSISNGLTQKRILEDWKKSNPADVCKVCQGEGKVFCPTCKGTGRLAAAAKDCPTCKGAQTIPCTTPKCDHGKIPCPKPHIKLTEGTWVMHADGKRWRSFPNGHTISESHLGQITENNNPAPHDCPLCEHNSMVIPDPKCKGTGLMPCNACTTAALKADKCPACEKGKVNCKACVGTGVASLGPGPEDPAATQPAPQ